MESDIQEKPVIYDTKNALKYVAENSFESQVQISPFLAATSFHV